jgi:hypothetical protein
MREGVNTRYAALPLRDTEGEFEGSVAHSRVQLHAESPVEDARVVVYLEADFLTPPGHRPWRWRQYWAEVSRGGWRLLGGHSWSLLRPNRKGISSENELMNTIVVDPAYHLGLAGIRRRSLRLTRELGSHTAAAVEWASGGTFLAKVATDANAGHFEVMGGGGARGRAAAGLAHIIHVSARVNAVGQELWTRGLGPELLGFEPPGVWTLSTLHGIEAEITRALSLFGYGGIVYGSQSSGNRLGRQWTAGFQQRVFTGGPGILHFAAQISQVDRAVWRGVRGSMWYCMASARWTVSAH